MTKVPIYPSGLLQRIPMEGNVEPPKPVRAFHLQSTEKIVKPLARKAKVVKPKRVFNKQPIVKKTKSSNCTWCGVSLKDGLIHPHCQEAKDRIAQNQ